MASKFPGTGKDRAGAGAGWGRADSADRQEEVAKPGDLTSALLLVKIVGCSPGTQLPG